MSRVHPPRPHPRQRRRRASVIAQRAVASPLPELRRAPAAPPAARRVLRRAAPRDPPRRRPAAPLEDSLSIYTWGDYDAPDVLEGFTAEPRPEGHARLVQLERGAHLEARRGQGHERLRHRRADRRLHPADDRERPAREAQPRPHPEHRAHGPGVPRPRVGPRQRVLDLQGVGHDRLRLRQDRDHARAERRGTTSSTPRRTRPAARPRCSTTRPSSRASTSGRTASTGTPTTRPTSTRPRTTS